MDIKTYNIKYKILKSVHRYLPCQSCFNISETPLGLEDPNLLNLLSDVDPVDAANTAGVRGVVIQHLLSEVR